MFEATQGPGGGACAEHVRAAVAAVVREARDARDEPFDGELAMALTLHAWAHLIERAMEPRAFAVIASGARGARYEAVSVDAFDVDSVRSVRLDAALDALHARGRAVAAALIAVPIRATVGTFPERVELERERSSGASAPSRPVAAALGSLPSAMLARVDDGGVRQTHLLMSDGRCEGAGCTTLVELRGSRLCLAHGTEPQPLPTTFVAALGGFPWERAGARAEIPRGCSLGSGGTC